MHVTHFLAVAAPAVALAVASAVAPAAAVASALAAPAVARAAAAAAFALAAAAAAAAVAAVAAAAAASWLFATPLLLSLGCCLCQALLLLSKQRLTSLKSPLLFCQPWLWLNKTVCLSLSTHLCTYRSGPVRTLCV